MKKLFAVTVTVLMLLVAFIATAQQDSTKSAEDDVFYTIEKGDTLWALEGKFSGKPWMWKRIVDLNPFLKEPGRFKLNEESLPIVMLEPGEKLIGMKKLGITPKKLPYEELKGIIPVPTSSTPVKPANPNWLWQLLTVTALLCAIVVLLKMQKNPVTVGPAMIYGGVDDETVTSQFRTNKVWPATLTSNDRIEVKDVVKGKIFGLVRIKYGDNKSRIMILTNEIGYRAMVRRNDGPWTEEFMLQGCGNDVRSGTRYIPGFGFRFISEDPVMEETPQPAVRATASSSISMSEIATTDAFVPSPEATEDAKYFVFRPATGSLQNLVQFKGFKTFEIEEVRGQMSVRFK